MPLLHRVQSLVDLLGIKMPFCSCISEVRLTVHPHASQFGTSPLKSLPFTPKGCLEDCPVLFNRHGTTIGIHATCGLTAYTASRGRRVNITRSKGTQSRRVNGLWHVCGSGQMGFSNLVDQQAKSFTPPLGRGALQFLRPRVGRGMENGGGR